MAQLIQDLPQPESYDANSSWLLIEHDNVLYKVQASVFLDSYALQSEYIDTAYRAISFQDSTFSFSRDYLLSDQSSFCLSLEFGEKIKFPSATLIKNAGETNCKLLTFEGLLDIPIDTTSDVLNLSKYSTQNGRTSNVVGTISLSSTQSSITIGQLKLENVSELPAVQSGYVCAKIQARAINV
jgi:hypothetical protein